MLPRRIILVGGGYVAAEFSHIAARAGSQVTVLQRGKSTLNRFDPELVDWLMASFKAIGVDVHTRSSVEAIEKNGNAYRVRAAHNLIADELKTTMFAYPAGASDIAYML